MKISEYTPLYGIIGFYKTIIYIDGRKMTIEELLEHENDFELSDYDVDTLDMHGLFALQEALNDDYFTPETTIPYLRNLFDDFKDITGNPLVWLTKTIYSVVENSQNYKPELRGVIETELAKWIEFYSKVSYANNKHNKPPLSLDDIFSSKKHLNKLVDELTAKGFCYYDDQNSLTWTGIKHHIAKKPKSQLIALAFLCQPYYKKTNYLQKELQQAWTTHFNIYISKTMFSEGKRPGIVYNDLFKDIITSLRYT